MSDLGALPRLVQLQSPDVIAAILLLVALIGNGYRARTRSLDPTGLGDRVDGLILRGFTHLPVHARAS